MLGTEKAKKKKIKDATPHKNSPGKLGKADERIRSGGTT
jgi:hypothetical protein